MGSGLVDLDRAARLGRLVKRGRDVLGQPQVCLLLRDVGARRLVDNLGGGAAGWSEDLSLLLGHLARVCPSTAFEIEVLADRFVQNSHRSTAYSACRHPSTQPACAPPRAGWARSNAGTLAAPGAIAQLGERLVRIEEVGGSSPPSSTDGRRYDRPSARRLVGADLDTGAGGQRLAGSDVAGPRAGPDAAAEPRLARRPAAARPGAGDLKLAA